MSWTPPHRNHLGGQQLPVPDDGIFASNHPLGWVGKRWEALFDRAPGDSRDRLLRGKNYARRGRARLLHISPGVATAEVVCDALYRPSLRVRPFGRGEWSEIIKRLLEDLDAIASLLEGELPVDLVSALDKRGVALLPRYDELSFDCDCGDYVMPCTHVATVGHVLKDALDGDPFLLLTLRGRTREHLMSTLRSRWGDERTVASEVAEVEEAPPSGEWFSARAPMPDYACSFEQKVALAAGLRALGPPPGEVDLVGTLQPLYEAGAKASAEVLGRIPEHRVRRRRSAMVAESPAPPARAPVPAAPAAPPTPAAPPAPPAEPERQVIDLTELLIDHLAAHDGSNAKQIAIALQIPVPTVRREMLELEELGIVYQSDGTSGRAWWLG